MLTLNDEIPTDVFSVDDVHWSEDPNKGEFGGLPEQDGWRLSAELSPTIGPDKPVCNVLLKLRWIEPSQPVPVGASVIFHLHPSFNVTAQPLAITNGEAQLRIVAWGAFTVGAEIIAGTKRTRLELDLAEVPGGTVRFYQE